MKRIRLTSLFVWFGLLLGAAASRGGEDVVERPVWPVAWTEGEVCPIVNRDEAAGVLIDGEACYDPERMVVRVSGVLRTRQPIEEGSQLAYHLYATDGRVLEYEGQRFAWRTAADGMREAAFTIEQALTDEVGVRPGVRVQFDYVVEHGYWQSRKYPETVLPCLEVLPPARPAFFDVVWWWAPPVFPAHGRSWFPAWVRAQFGYEPPPPYLASPDLRTLDGATRIESPRRPLPTTGDSSGWVWYRFEEIAPQRLLLRPGFVWEDVSWFSQFGDTPYQRVWVVGPLPYVVGLSLALAGLMVAWQRVERSRRPRLRLLGLLVIALVGAWFVVAAAVSLNVLVLVGLAALWWMQLRVREPGVRLYWTSWGYLLLLDFYCLHVATEAMGQWAGTAFSAALTGLVLLPLRWVRGPRLAAIVGTGLAVLVALTASAMTVYLGFFSDYPGVSDLLHAGQLGELGDSIWNLIGQRHLVPWWLLLCSCWGLWRGWNR